VIQYGEEISPRASLIHVRVQSIDQLFHRIDPSPFAGRDLDPEADQFIVTWARDFPTNAHLALRIDVAGAGEDEATLRSVPQAVHTYFGLHAAAHHRELGTLLRRGRISLLIGLTFLSICVLLADVLSPVVPSPRAATILQESLTVAGWVSMWRPMEIFLYAWWPIVGERRLYRRLSRMPVSIITP
jgi:hypothetical protein